MKENFSKKSSTGSVPTRTNNIIVHLFSMDAKSLSTRLCRILFHSSRSRFCKSKKGNGSIGLAAMRCPNVSRCVRSDLNQECMLETLCAACTYKSSFMQSGIIIHWIKDFLMPVVYDQSHTSMRHFHHVFTSFGRQIAIPYIMTCKFTRTSILIAVHFINPPTILGYFKCLSFSILVFKFQTKSILASENYLTQIIFCIQSRCSTAFLLQIA